MQTGLTWNKPINDQHEIYAMAYAGQRSVTQYQSIPQTAQGGVNHAGGVIDFDRNFLWYRSALDRQRAFTQFKTSLRVLHRCHDEERRGYENFAGTVLGVKGDLRRNEDNSLWNIDPYAQASYALTDAVNVDAGLRYSNVHFKPRIIF